MKKLLLVMISILVLTCGCIYLPASPATTTPTTEQKPIVNSFSADPPSISSGGTSTLSWSVTGATSVSLDNGIGNVAVSGTRAVAPTSSTTYVLTASNSSGSTNATTQVLISGASATTPPTATGIPAVTSFSASPGSITSGASSTLTWSVANATSVNIQPGIGNVAASGSTAVTPASSTQYILTATNSSGSVIASTQIVVSSGSGTTTPTGPGIHILPGAFAILVYNFVAKAPDASWGSGGGALTFPGADTDNKGFALWRNNATLEDDKVYTQVLETHPQWVTGGTIWGTYASMYNTYKVQSSDHFYTKVGFIKGATAGNVRFRVMIRTESSGNIWIADVSKVYNGSLTTIDVPLSAYAGQKADFILRVEANNTNATQDWATWTGTQITR